MKNVLFINKDKDVHQRVKAILDQQEDYNLFIATTVEEAYRIIEEKDINFVLFDVDVALDQGVNRMLEMKDKYPDMPIVATTPIQKGDPRDAIPPQPKREMQKK